MTTPSPSRFDLTLHTSTDQSWEFQRVSDNGTPIIPTSAQAQIRNRPNGDLWLSLTCTVNNVTGIVTVKASRAATSGNEWDKRTRGAWDLVVLQGTDRLRIVEGAVDISPEVTQWV